MSPSKLLHDSMEKTSLNRFLSVLSLSHFSQHIYVSRSVLYTYILNALGLNYAQIGLATGASHALGGFLQMFFSLAGRLVPKRLLLAFSNASMSLALFGIGLSNNFLSFFSSQVVGEVGGAAIHPVSVDLISERLENKNVSTYIGIFYGLGYIGNILGPVILAVAALIYGWRFALFATAVIPFLTGILLFVSLRGDRSFVKTRAMRRRSSLLDDVKSAFHVKGLVAVIAAQAFLVGGTGQGVIATFIPLFLSNGLYLDQLHSSLLYSLAMFGGVIGTIFFGKYANKFGYLKTTIFCTSIASLSIFLLSLQVVNNFTLIPNLIILSLTAFPITSLMQSSLVTFSTQRQRDFVLGLFLAIGFGVSSLWSSLIGFLIDIYGSFIPAWYTMAGLGCIALLFQIFAYKQRSTKQDHYQSR